MSPAPKSDALQSLADVYDIELVTAKGADRGAPPGVLIEVPHGATRLRHFTATRRRLTGSFPDDLEQFFYVNTDVGSIECARFVAQMATAPDAYPELEGLASPSGHERRRIESVLILRGLVARTFIDCNRVITGGPSSSLHEGMTPGLPGYVRDPADVDTLKKMHGDYQSAAVRAYETVCGQGGTALILHTYAPRSIHLTEVDEGIVAALRRAYEPKAYETWELRPDVDMISEGVDGERLAPEALARDLRERYARIGVEVTENATYRLHRETMGYVHSSKYPNRVLCLEINRRLLADPFTPFAEMSISAAKARRMAAPIAAALLSLDPSASVQARTD